MKIICSRVLELLGYFKNKQTNKPPNKKTLKTRQTLSDSTVGTLGFNFALISRRCDIGVLLGVNRGKGIFPAFLKHKTFFLVLCAVSRKKTYKTLNQLYWNQHVVVLSHYKGLARYMEILVMSTHLFDGFLLTTT